MINGMDKFFFSKLEELRGVKVVRIMLHTFTLSFYLVYSVTDFQINYFLHDSLTDINDR